MGGHLRVTILGCGSSPGTPRITGEWGACDPANPRNRRLRCSALLERIGPSGVTTVVVDCGPDFRQQMLSAKVRRIDGVLITHPHADHCHGLDDLRGYMLMQKALIPIYADTETQSRLIEAFRYCYETPPGSDYQPVLRHVPVIAGEPIVVDGAGGPMTILPFEQIHGRIHSLGLRIGPMAYCTDVSDFPAAAVAAIAGAQHVIIDALQYTPHPSHLSLQQALDWLDRFGVEAGTLIHMHIPLDYETLCNDLPAHVRPGYDGLQLDFTLDES